MSGTSRRNVCTECVIRASGAGLRFGIVVGPSVKVAVRRLIQRALRHACIELREQGGQLAKKRPEAPEGRQKQPVIARNTEVGSTPP